MSASQKAFFIFWATFAMMCFALYILLTAIPIVMAGRGLM